MVFPLPDSQLPDSELPASLSPDSPDPKVSKPQSRCRSCGVLRRILLGVAGLLFVCGVAGAITYYFLPWKPALNALLSGQIKTALVRLVGHGDVHVTLSDITPFGASIRDVRVGGQSSDMDMSATTLESVELDYNIRTLWNDRRIHGATISGLSLGLDVRDGRLRVSGLQERPLEAQIETDAKATSESEMEPFFSAAYFEALPLDKISVENSRIRASYTDWSVTSGWEGAAYMQAAVPTLSLKFPSIEGQGGTAGNKVSFTANHVILDANLDEANKKWTGHWTLDKAAIVKAGKALPIMDASGNFELFTDHAVVSGTAKDAAGLYTASFRLDIPISNGKSLKATLSKAEAQWMGGALSLAQPLTVDLPIKKAITAHVRMSKVSIDQLMQSVTGSRVTATGDVSGTVPVIIAKDGTFDLGAGKLEAASAGQMAMPPEALPGDNPQVGLLRDVMKNFHYSGLSIEVVKGEDGKTALLLGVEGSNPDVYNGRAVKLNVNLTGDVLSLFQQNMLFLTDPKKILEHK